MPSNDICVRATNRTVTTNAPMMTAAVASHASSITETRLALEKYREPEGAINPAPLLRALLDSLADPKASQPSRATAAAALVLCEDLITHLRALAVDPGMAAEAAKEKQANAHATAAALASAKASEKRVPAERAKEPKEAETQATMVMTAADKARKEEEQEAAASSDRKVSVTEPVSEAASIVASVHAHALVGADAAPSVAHGTSGGSGAATSAASEDGGADAEDDGDDAVRRRYVTQFL